MQLKLRQGFTLVELLISLSIGFLISAAASQSLIAINSAQLSQLAYQHLALELEALMNQMVQDIRRTAYINNNGQTSMSAGNRNPLLYDSLSQAPLFSFATVESNSLATGSYDCILLAYDANDDGQNSGSSERFGYRYSENAVKVRNAGGSCQQSGWIKISDDQNLVISKLSFTPIRQNIPYSTDLLRCSLFIQVEGYSLKNPEIRLSLSHMLSLGNGLRVFSSSASLCV